MGDVCRDMHTTIEVPVPTPNTSKAHLFTEDALQSYGKHLARHCYSIGSTLTFLLVVMATSTTNSQPTNILPPENPATLLLLESLFMIIFLKLLSRLRIIKPVTYSITTGCDFIIPSLLYCIDAMSTKAGIIYIRPSITILSVVTAPVIVAMFSALVLRNLERYSSQAYIAALLVTVGGCTAVFTDLLGTGTLEEYCLASIHCLALSMMYLFLRKRMKQRYSFFNTLYALSINNLPILLIMFCYKREISMNSVLLFKSVSQIPVLSLQLFMNFMVMFCKVWGLKWNSALATCVVASSIVLLIEIKHMVTVLGLVVYVLGTVSYMQIKCSTSCKSQLAQMTRATLLS